MRKVLFGFWRIITAPLRWFNNGIIILIKRTPLNDFLAEEPEDVPLLDTLRKATEDPKEFLLALIEHLDALRGHLLRSVIALFITTLIALYFIQDIIAWLTKPIGGIDTLQAISVTEPISVAMRVSLMTGFVLALPYICFELLRFIAPGISRRARWIGLFGIPSVFVLFFAGMFFTYKFVLPAAIPILLHFLDFVTVPTPSDYLKFITNLMFWIGISFEFPLIAFLLAAMGLLPPHWLKNQWRIVIIVLTVFAAMITPTVDPINMMIVFIPLLLLYLMSIFTARIGQGLRIKKKDTVEDE